MQPMMQVYPQNNQYPPSYPQTQNMMNSPAPYVMTQQPGVDPYMNNQIAVGFGDMFYNMNDPNIAKTNVPIKQDSSNHTATIIGTILFVAGLVVGGVGFRRFLIEDYSVALVIGLTYLVYLAVVICVSDIRGYITNLKKFDEYKLIYDSMVRGRGFFKFWIECYHYRTVKTKNGTRRQKVVTHTASQVYYPRMSEDISGNIVGIQDITKYVFINYQRKYFFADPRSQSAYNAQYQAFISANRRDQYQSYTSTFDIEGFQEQVGFCALGQGSHNSVLFYLTAFLGLSLIYSCILERSVSRYSINIVKKLTC